MKAGRESPPSTKFADKESLENRPTQSIYSALTDSKNLVLMALVEGIRGSSRGGHSSPGVSNKC